jgi:hypothetical protein
MALLRRTESGGLERLVKGLEVNTTVLAENPKNTVHFGDQGMDGRTITIYSKEIGVEDMDIIYQALLN